MKSTAFCELYHNGGRLEKKDYTLKPDTISKNLLKEKEIKEIKKETKEHLNNLNIHAICEDLLDFSVRFETYIKKNSQFSIWDFDTYIHSLNAYYNCIFITSDGQNSLLLKIRKYSGYSRTNWKDLEYIVFNVKSEVKKEIKFLRKLL